MDDASLMGRVMALAMHDMQNILAVIKESAGLMDDLLAKGGQGFALRERFEGQTELVRQQVERASRLAELVSRFAHAPGEGLANCDLGVLTRRVTLLCERATRQCRLTLDVAEPGGEPVRAEVEPFGFMAALIRITEACMASLPQGGTLRIDILHVDGRPVVRIGCGKDAERIAREVAATGLPRGLSVEAVEESVRLGLTPRT